MKHPRVLIKDIIKRYHALPGYCKDCGVEMDILFNVSDRLWDTVMFGREKQEVCLGCFVKRARRLGIEIVWSEGETVCSEDGTRSLLLGMPIVVTKSLLVDEVVLKSNRPDGTVDCVLVGNLGDKNRRSVGKDKDSSPQSHSSLRV